MTVPFLVPQPSAFFPILPNDDVSIPQFNHADWFGSATAVSPVTISDAGQTVFLVVGLAALDPATPGVVAIGGGDFTLLADTSAALDWFGSGDLGTIRQQVFSGTVSDTPGDYAISLTLSGVPNETGAPFAACARMCVIGGAAPTLPGPVVPGGNSIAMAVPADGAMLVFQTNSLSPSGVVNFPYFSPDIPRNLPVAGFQSETVIGTLWPGLMVSTSFLASGQDFQGTPFATPYAGQLDGGTPNTSLMTGAALSPGGPIVRQPRRIAITTATALPCIPCCHLPTGYVI